MDKDKVQTGVIPTHTSPYGEDDSDSDEEEHQAVLPRIAQFAISECFIYFTFLLFYTALLVISRANGELNFMQSRGIEYNFNSRGKGGSDPDADGFSRVDSRFEDLNYLIRDDQINYLTPADITDVWTVIEMVVVPMLLPERHDNGDLITTPTERLMVTGQNRLLGGIRMRQVRVDAQECDVASLCEDDPECEFLTTPGASEIFAECYPEYTKSSEMKTPFTYGSQTMNWSSKEENVEQMVYFAAYASYGGGGYVVDLPLDHQAAASRLYELRANKWIDRATRALFVDFNLYNANENLHTVSRISYEFPSVGGVYASSEIKTWRFLRYLGYKGMTIYALEIVYVVFVAWFTIDEVREYISEFKNGPKGAKLTWYFKVDPWNYIDMVNLVFFYFSLYFRVTISMAAQDVKYLDVYNYNSYRFIVSSYNQEAFINMMNGFFLWIKAFKFFNCNPKIRLVFSMIAKAADDLAYFAFSLFMILIAFACIAFAAFCTDVEHFKSFPETMISLIQFIVSDMDLESMKSSNSTMAVPLYIFWTIIMVFILANVFIAIISEAYIETKEEVASNKINVREMIREGVLKNLLLKFVKFNDADKDGDGKIDLEELAQMQSAGAMGHGQSAQDIISKYDKDGDGQLDEREYSMFQKTLVGNKKSMRS